MRRPIPVLESRPQTELDQIGRVLRTYLCKFQKPKYTAFDKVSLVGTRDSKGVTKKLKLSL